MQRLGLGQSADPSQCLAISADSTRLSDGDADHRLSANRSAPGATASLVSQSDGSGRDQLGLKDDDGPTFKTSADGQTWRLAVTFKASGATLPNSTIFRAPDGAKGGQLDLAQFEIGSSLGGDFAIYLLLNTQRIFDSAKGPRLLTRHEGRLEAGVALEHTERPSALGSVWAARSLRRPAARARSPTLPIAAEHRLQRKRVLALNVRSQ